MLKDKLRLFEVQINLSTPQMMCVQISLYAFFRFCEINVLEMVLNHLFYPNLTIRCQKIEKGLLHTNSKLYMYKFDRLKTEYLIAQLRTGFRQKVFRLKTCPQGVLQAQ